MPKFPQLKTDRLLLRKIYYTDIPTIVKYAGDAKVAATTLNIPHPYHPDDAMFWINMANEGFKNKTEFIFGVCIQSTKELIGGIGLTINNRFNRAEIGYWIAVSFWNKGYATEAVKAILTFGFNELNLNKILATHLVENPASGKVMMKNGMIKEAALKEHVKKGEVYKSLVQYRLTKAEYEQLAI